MNLNKNLHNYRDKLKSNIGLFVLNFKFNRERLFYNNRILFIFLKFLL